MRKTTTPVRKRRFSKFLTKTKKSQTFAFVRDNRGSISFSSIGDLGIKCLFRSRITGRSAFAYGINMEVAYSNMQRNFHLKYAA